MSVGYQPASKGAVDSRAGNLATQWRDLITATRQYGAWLGGQTDVALQSLPNPGGNAYTTDEVALLKSAFTQLVAGCDQLEGKASPPGSANNYLFFSDQIAQP